MAQRPPPQRSQLAGGVGKAGGPTSACVLTAARGRMNREAGRRAVGVGSRGEAPGMAWCDVRAERRLLVNSEPAEEASSAIKCRRWIFTNKPM